MPFSHTTFGGTPVDGSSAGCRKLYLTTNSSAGCREFYLITNSSAGCREFYLITNSSAGCREFYLTKNNTYDIHPCNRRDLNPQSQQANDRRPTP
jgi:hypothetical protein